MITIGSVLERFRGKVWIYINFIATSTVNFTPPHLGETVDSFFRTREGLYVWDEFRKVFKEFLNAPLVPISTELSYYFLKNEATDLDIEGEFQRKKIPFIFENPAHFLATMAGLILNQWGGKPGPLRNDSMASLFYVRVAGEIRVVFVQWLSIDDKWRILVYRCSEVEWSSIGTRIFSCNQSPP